MNIQKYQMRAVFKSALDAAAMGEPPEPQLLALLDRNDFSSALDDLELDSLQAMEFCISIELSTGAQLSVQTVMKCKTFADLANWIDANARKTIEIE